MKASGYRFGFFNTVFECLSPGILAGMQAGLDFETCARGLKLFDGVDRRFHFKGEKKGIRIYDDYGHYPTDLLIHTMWHLPAKETNKEIICSKSPEEFFALADEIDLDSPIYVDVNLG